MFEFMCSIQLQSFLDFFEIPVGIFQIKDEKKMAINYLHVSDHSEWETRQTDFYLCELYYSFHLISF
jgi:hypothetical protein